MPQDPKRKTSRIREETFWKKYKPIKNKILPEESWEGCMFETYGKALDFVDAQPPEHVWTLLDCDGRLIVVSGRHHVNRIGYFVTKVPWEYDQQFYADT